MEDTKKYIYYIYKIVYENKEQDLSYIYIGSTNDIKQRYSSHISNMSNPNTHEYNTKKYKVMRENGGVDNFKMVVIYTSIEPITKTEAHIIEEQYRLSEQANLNDCRCYRTETERIEQLKNYYGENKQKTLDRQKNYYAENIVEIKQKRKEYRQNNKEHKRLQARAYYLKKKEKRLSEPQTQIQQTQIQNK
jgi:hypothetical protein